MKKQKNKKQFCYGRNIEGYLCVWDNKNDVMHYFGGYQKDDSTLDLINIAQVELNQAKIFTLLLRIAEKIGGIDTNV
jgi:hypothetical protein